MNRTRLALATLVAVAASTVGVTSFAAPANAGVLGCVSSALNLEKDLRHDAVGAVGGSLALVQGLLNNLVVDVLTLNLTAIQGQAQAVVVDAGIGAIVVSAQTLIDANNTVTACRVS